MSGCQRAARVRARVMVLQVGNGRLRLLTTKERAEQILECGLSMMMGWGGCRGEESPGPEKGKSYSKKTGSLCVRMSCRRPRLRTDSYRLVVVGREGQRERLAVHVFHRCAGTGDEPGPCLQRKLLAKNNQAK